MVPQDPRPPLLDCTIMLSVLVCIFPLYTKSSMRRGAEYCQDWAQRLILDTQYVFAK